nr:unnamed protein product [Digitaria exilis]
MFGEDGDGNVVDVRGEALGVKVLMVAAWPYDEAVVRNGPFVMNTSTGGAVCWPREEVEQAWEDFRHCRNGFEMANGWTSDHAVAATHVDTIGMEPRLLLLLLLRSPSPVAAAEPRPPRSAGDGRATAKPQAASLRCITAAGAGFHVKCSHDA